MIIDAKQPFNEKRSLSTNRALTLDQVPLHPSQPKHFYVELPAPKIVYTVNSTVSGIIHLNRADPASIQEIQVSIVCSVRSRFHKNRGGNSQDNRRETTNLFHRDQSLWSRRSADETPPSSLPFAIRIPESGIDPKVHDNNASLPPSFYAERKASLFSYTRLIGFVKYYVEARVIRKGFFKSNETIAAPFIFLPPSAPPPLLPAPPESISDQELDQLRNSWTEDAVFTTIRQSIFNRQGQAKLSLWLPRVDKLPRGMFIPFFLCLHLRTVPGKFQDDQPPSSFLSTPPQLDKASLYLHQKLRVCARRAVQVHVKTYDQNVTDNFVYSITPQESDWKCVSDLSGSCWEKGYIWRGRWKFTETPNFTNRQLTLKYFLIAKIPFKGLGNDTMLISKELDIGTGILVGDSEIPMMATVEPELLPGYFDLNAASDEEEPEQDDNLAEKS